jgi:hypothetical protein
MRVHGGGLRGSFLTLETSVDDETAARRIGVGQPHAEGSHAVGEGSLEAIAAVDDLERADLGVGHAGRSGGIGGSDRRYWGSASHSMVCEVIRHSYRTGRGTPGSC